MLLIFHHLYYVIIIVLCVLCSFVLHSLLFNCCMQLRGAIRAFRAWLLLFYYLLQTFLLQCYVFKEMNLMMMMMMMIWCEHVYDVIPPFICICLCRCCFAWQYIWNAKYDCLILGSSTLQSRQLELLLFILQMCFCLNYFMAIHAHGKLSTVY